MFRCWLVSTDPLTLYLNEHFKNIHFAELKIKDTRLWTDKLEMAMILLLWKKFKANSGIIYYHHSLHYHNI